VEENSKIKIQRCWKKFTKLAISFDIQSIRFKSLIKFHTLSFEDDRDLTHLKIFQLCWITAAALHQHRAFPPLVLRYLRLYDTLYAHPASTEFCATIEHVDIISNPRSINPQRWANRILVYIERFAKNIKKKMYHKQLRDHAMRKCKIPCHTIHCAHVIITGYTPKCNTQMPRFRPTEDSFAKHRIQAHSPQSHFPCLNCTYRCYSVALNFKHWILTALLCRSLLKLQC